MFTNSSVKATNPPTYIIKDTLGETVQGASIREEGKPSIRQVGRLQ